jgi:hypothetical protein
VPDVCRLGGVAGLCALARVDFVVLGVVLFGWLWFEGKLSWRAGVLVMLVSGAVVLPWIAYVHATTGTVVPTSGIAQAGRPVDLGDFVGRTRALAEALIPVTTVVLYLPRQTIAMLIALLGGMASIVWLLRAEVRDLGRDVRIWLAASAVLASYYLIASSAGHFYGRYLAPWWFAWSLWLAGALALKFRTALRRTPIHIVAAAGLTLLFAVQVGYTLHRGHASNDHLHTALFLRDPHRVAGVIGAFQSGLVGYVTEERVINLDGKVNTRALEWRERGRLDCYLAERRITTVVDWPEYIDNGWIPRAFVQSSMREIGRVPQGLSVVMAVTGSPVDCPELPSRRAARTTVQKETT